MLTRTSTNPAYGRLWWLNGGGYGPRRRPQHTAHGRPADRRRRRRTSSPPRARRTASSTVVASRKLIVVRMGQAAPDRDFNQQLWTRLMKAFPRNSPVSQRPEAC